MWSGERVTARNIIHNYHGGRKHLRRNSEIYLYCSGRGCISETGQYRIHSHKPPPVEGVELSPLTHRGTPAASLLSSRAWSLALTAVSTSPRIA